MSSSELKDKRLEKVPLGEQLHDSNASAFSRYRNKAVGDLSFGRFCLFEFFVLCLAGLGGALGYVVRKIVARRIFRSVGKGLILGRWLVIRHPGRIQIGDNVAIDDYVFLDASGSGERGIELHDGVILSRNCVVQGKLAHVVLENRVDVGCNCVFSSIRGVEIGESTIIAGNCYFGGARYFHSDLEMPIMDQGNFSRGAVVVGPHCWIGAGAVVLDGVTIGRGCIVGAGAVVTRDVEPFSIVAGVPAKVIGTRKPES